MPRRSPIIGDISATTLTLPKVIMLEICTAHTVQGSDAAVAQAVVYSEEVEAAVYGSTGGEMVAPVR